jgi:hypothetical protein|tara:strand:+ start:28 stop:975 length:948 start_codon:yes stop_codon:yes gene_type:complete
MPDTASNIIVQTVGTTANIATDYGTSGVNLGSAHVPLNKIAFGNSGAATRVSSADPLPITVSGSDVAISVSGNVGSCGEFGVANYSDQWLKVAGSTAGAGITVQGTVSVTAGSGAEGLYVTGGIIGGLTSARDTVGITGTVSLVDLDGTTMSGSRVKVYSGNTAIGVSGNALLVSLIDAGLTVDVSLSATVGVTNDIIENGLKIQGYTLGTDVGITAAALNINSVSLPSAFTAGAMDLTLASRKLDSFSMSSGAKLRAAPANTGIIYIGGTGGGLGITSGYPLQSGESCFLELNNLNLVYAVGGITGQSLTFFAS